MTDKSLQEKAIDFKGKLYVQVKDRVEFFNSKYSNGSIKTELLSTPDADMVIVKATVKPEGGDIREFTGMSQAKWSDTKSFVNASSALENAETSAVGRALAFMGIGVIDSVASIDEINKTTYVKPQNTPKTASVAKDGESCPKCGGKLKEIVSKKNGRTYLKCENGTFNNGVAGGCDFFKEDKPISNDEDIY